MGTEPAPGKAPIGQNSGATAVDFVKKADPSELTVGKLTQAQLQGGQYGRTGSPWADQGARCDNSFDGAAGGCFLDDRRRDHLITDIKIRAVTAATNYKLALEQMRVAELLKKEDDLPWVLSLALDVATGFVAGKVTKALGKIKAAGLNAEADAAWHGEGFDRSRTDKVLQALSDKSIEKWTKSAFDAAGKQVKGTIKKAQGADAKDDKSEALSFIAQLTNASDKSFEKFANNAATTANDGELSVLYEGLDPENHAVDLYKAALDEKLKRYMKSGVTDIGRKIGKDRETKLVDVKQDTRVVWVEDRSFGRRLWFEEQDADHDPAVMQPGDPGYSALDAEQQPDKLNFGTKSPRNDIKLMKIVPDEFIEAAVARSEAVWGPTRVIDSPMNNYLKQVGSSTMTTPSGGPPPIIAGATTGAGAGADGTALPPGSVFGRKKKDQDLPAGAPVAAPPAPNFMAGDPKDQKP